MTNIISVSTWYPDAIESAYVGTDGLCYADMLARFEDALFGSDMLWSAALRRATKWNIVDVIANADRLQAKWRAEEMGCRPASQHDTVLAQIRAANADVVILQDVSFLPAASLLWIRERGIVIAAQVSCPMPPPDRLAMVDVAFTSFPHYVERLRGHGVKRIEFMPLAFETNAVNRVMGSDGQLSRYIDVAFVGGVGADAHWRSGTRALEALAYALDERFAWYGYGLDRLDPMSPLRACWRGEAWGRSMYSAYLRSKIVVNRHGEVAEGSGNNLRQYEATGCGACLLTDQAGQFKAGVDCVVYRDDVDIVEQAKSLLADDERRLRVAASGYGKTLAQHCYKHRVSRIAEILAEEVLKKRASL